MASTARLDELKKKFDENPRRYFAPLANEHRKSGDLEQAIALCRAHLPQQPAHISGHIVMGQALFEAQQLDESRDTFHTALDLDPENLIALRYLGDIARTGGDIATARSWYQRVLEVDPRNDEIVQLIRDLDAPPVEPASSEAPSDEPVAMASVPSAADAATSPPAVPGAPTDARFAPLTSDQLESDTELFAVSGDAAASHEAVSSSDASAWSTDSATAEMPMLDVPEIDPFDMPRAGTAESLFDMGTPSEPSQSDLLLDELAMPESMDIGDLAAGPSDGQDSWTSAAAPEPPAAAAPEFEEGSFYLEPPAAPTTGWSPPDATDAAATVQDVTLPERIDVPHSAASHDEAPMLDGSWDVEPAPSPMAATPNEIAPEPELGYPQATVDAQPAQPSYEAPALSEAPQQAAAQSNAAPLDDGLGLEVMEFVPPSRSDEAASQPSQLEADPLIGHMPELSAPGSGPRPLAFVTETMAELYLQQGFTNEALAVYHELLTRNPDDTSLRDRIQQIESGSMSSLGMAMLSENVVESARKRQTERPARSVRSFFASLAGRRAPHSQQARPESTAYYADAESEGATGSDASAWPTEESAPAESEPQALAYDAGLDEPGAPPAPTVESSRSAADQMAAFDPFADTWDPTPPVAGAAPNDVRSDVDALPRPQAQPSVAFDNPPSEAIPFSTPAPEKAAEPRATPRTLEDLFPESSATPRADAAAQTLATAFGRSEPQGRPTRAASNQLSLDRVFRGAPEGAPAPEGGFSFDQFFSDTRTAGGDAASASVAPNAADSTRTGESSDSHDIEQFTAWLEGLKKK